MATAVGWGMQVCAYTGDGVDGRTIATDFPLDTGVVAIFIYPHQGTNDDGFCRTTAMTQTASDGSATMRDNCITGFTATGFTIGIGEGGTTPNPNALNRRYIAIVLRDSTAGNDWLRTDEYIGNAVDGRAITVGFQPTHVWIVGRSFHFRSPEMTGDVSISLNDENMAGLDNRIQSVTATGFTIGTNNNVNANLNDYAYIALAGDADLYASGFYSFVQAGTGAIAAVTGFGFAPLFGMARSASLTADTRWKTECSHADPASQISGGNVDPSAGVRSMDADGFTVGTGISVSGSNFYGFGWGIATGEACDSGGGGGIGDGLGPGSFYSYTAGFGITTGCAVGLAQGSDSGGGSGCENNLGNGSDTGGGSGCEVNH